MTGSRKSKSLAAVLSLLFLILSAIPTQAQRHRLPFLAIRNVTVIDVVEGRSLPAMTVIIRGERIMAIGTAAHQNIPRGARVIDGTDKFLIPGLWDMHTHFTADTSTLNLFIAHGITGVRDMGSIALKRVGDRVENLERDAAIKLIIDAREAVRQKRIHGPVIFTPGMIITGPNPQNRSEAAAPHQIVVKTDSEARAAVKRLADFGVDFIKVHALLSRETYRAIIDEAGKRNLPVVGHVPLALDPVEASEAGQASIEHLTGVWEYAHKGLPKTEDRMDPKRFADEIATFKKNHTRHVPTLVNYLAGAEAYRIVNDFDSEPALDYVVPELGLRWIGDWFLSDFTPKQSKAFRASVVTLQQMTAELNRNGVGILAGSDTGGIFTYAGISLHKELELLNQAGLSRMQTLQSATIGPAEFLRVSDELGSVSPGKFADLVLLRSDPLKDIRNTSAIDAVILRGKLLDRAHLDSMLKSVAERAKPTRQLMKTLKWGEG